MGSNCTTASQENTASDRSRSATAHQQQPLPHHPLRPPPSPSATPDSAAATPLSSQGGALNSPSPIAVVMPGRTSPTLLVAAATPLVASADPLSMFPVGPSPPPAVVGSSHPMLALGLPFTDHHQMHRRDSSSSSRQTDAAIFLSGGASNETLPGPPAGQVPLVGKAAAEPSSQLDESIASGDDEDESELVASRLSIAPAAMEKKVMSFSVASGEICGVHLRVVPAQTTTLLLAQSQRLGSVHSPRRNGEVNEASAAHNSSEATKTASEVESLIRDPVRIQAKVALTTDDVGMDYVNDYLVDQLLGEGNQGEVFRVVQCCAPNPGSCSSDSGHLAMKVLKRGLPSGPPPTLPPGRDSSKINSSGNTTTATASSPASPFTNAPRGIPPATGGGESDAFGGPGGSSITDSSRPSVLPLGFLANNHRSSNHHASSFDASGSAVVEAHIMSQLRHKNLVQLQEVIDDQNSRQVFLLMEYVDGGVLLPDFDSKTGTCTPLPPSVACGYLRQLCHGVSYLHRHHVTHRDIKPDNILLSKEGIVKLADFGVSVMSSDDMVTGVRGTPLFMAPELLALIGARDSSFRFTPPVIHGPATDVYSLGVLAFLVLTGRLPYFASSLHNLQAAVVLGSAESPPLWALLPAAPALWIKLLQGMLDRDPTKRWSMGKIQTALRKLA